MNRENEIDKILDSFLNKELAKEKSVALLTDLAVENPSAEIDLHVAASNVLRKCNNQKIVDEFHNAFIKDKSINRNKAVKPRKPVFKMILKMSMQIAAVLVLCLGTWFAYDYSNANADNIYANLNSDYIVNTERAQAQIEETNIVQAFKAKDYAQVVELYRAIAETTNRETFLVGYAQMQLGNYSASKSMFDKILQVNKTSEIKLYEDDAEYYLALSLLKLKDYKGALGLFEKIQSLKSHTYNDKITRTMIRRIRWL